MTMPDRGVSLDSTARDVETIGVALPTELRTAVDVHRAASDAMNNQPGGYAEQLHTATPAEVAQLWDQHLHATMQRENNVAARQSFLAAATSRLATAYANTQLELHAGVAAEFNTKAGPVNEAASKVSAALASAPGKLVEHSREEVDAYRELVNGLQELGPVTTALRAVTPVVVIKLNGFARFACLDATTVEHYPALWALGKSLGTRLEEWDLCDPDMVTRLVHAGVKLHASDADSYKKTVDRFNASYQCWDHVFDGHGRPGWRNTDSGERLTEDELLAEATPAAA